MSTVDDVTARWSQWEAMQYPGDEYPPGSLAGKVNGVDLAQLDGEVAYILHSFCTRRGLLRRRGLNDENRAALPIVLSELRRVVPALSGSGQAYFATALALIEDVAEAEAGQRI
jgi:hypothetical protein